jgi:selenocysteine-specific elongation factor
MTGQIRIDDELVLVPANVRVRVRGLQVHGHRCREAVCGQRTAINLGGIDVHEITRGQSLTTPEALTISRRLDAVLDVLPGARALKHGARVRFHQGTSELLGRISIAGANISAIAPGARAPVRIRLESAAAVTRGDRFIVRAYSPAVTIGGGEIIDPNPPRAGIRTAAAEKRLRALTGDRESAILQMIGDTEGIGLPIAALTSRAGEAPADAADVAVRLERTGRARLVADRLVGAEVMRLLAAQLLRLVGEFHQSHPLVDGIPREEARERVFARAHPAVFEQVLQDLAATNALVVRDRLALPGHRLELSTEEAKARDAIAQAYKRDGLKPRDVTTIAAEGRVSPTIAEKMTALLLRQKVLIRVDTLLFHADALQALKADILALKAAAPGARATVDVAMFKDRFGVTRKFAIPLLEWLDRERVTRRVGETRVVL